MRILNYASASYAALEQNAAHQFAANQALCFYQADAVYSFIPKNACSTLRLSLAIANGCIETTDDFNWIHNNNATFKADLRSLLTARYTFTVLRCPYARLASVYLDKIVDRNVQAWQLAEEVEKRKLSVEDLTFKQFVHILKRPSAMKANKHWRPQVDFLVYKNYDDYFCLEAFSAAIKTLEEKIGLSVVDARSLTKHGIDKFNLLSGDFSETAPSKIRAMKEQGQCPEPAALYTQELIEIVTQQYQADIKLYKKLFSEKNLMFLG